MLYRPKSVDEGFNSLDDTPPPLGQTQPSSEGHYRTAEKVTIPVSLSCSSWSISLLGA